MPPRDPDADISPGDAKINQHHATDYSSAKTGGKFKVDKAAAQQAINGLTAALEDLRTLDREANSLRTLAPPGGDPFTRHAVQEIARRATNEDGCHGKANAEYRKAILNMIDNLTAAMQGYASVEEMNRNIGGKSS
ncbi:hypothetical protein JOF53_003104 [Crossiella equi]|uniref:PE domain-containing protein n=1 Tax=Crossiella equi TaxID=130796 RepID=A0ABS5ACB7_9PSEU|nr:hypothetical protein [Crossiella equi]MBP2474232.1 hypothetical protein [Crossiella equi]